ncbi:hypothetical protein C8J56DRAFT_420604 [Mycena floridula]|nr:hypothetical protein C8J56DRAFT_420604 [Mycena floridula]
MFIRLISILCWVYTVLADNENGTTEDPFQKYRPAFARSLPVQILLTGIVLTLVAVLFIHLLFTAQYHWPLAPVNYVLQLSGVTSLLISLIATLHVVLSSNLEESKQWPYMLSYIAVRIPPMVDAPVGWTTVERATWLIMNATTSALIQITHIQFLTLLYPSQLEGRLIFSLLGPLAITASIVQLLPIQRNDHINSIASAVRNVCNATLSLLFTAALFIWGLLVNRPQAWRTDGGTAAFGAAALALALISTALNFLYVPKEDQYAWLPGLMWAVVLWQSFLGWWWWVGAGSGSGLTQDEGAEMRRREKRERRRHANKTGAKLVWKEFAGALVQRRETRPREESGSSDEVARSSSESPPVSPMQSSTNPTLHRTSSTTSLNTASTIGTLPEVLPGIVHRWYASLRQAHALAARRQTAERAARIRELAQERAGEPDPPDIRGWGLGSFALRSHRTNIAPRPGPTEDDSNTFEMNNRRGPAEVPPELRARPRSVWWWGPLGRWRLQDSTIY